ncbi:hypothetical protein [Bacillus altitudinis]|uniref:hypothetical protein n=1 Tax=Bacillus altitudinis TaxID=293387 RepID=UPI00210118DA|nr:hypothetical protein [Bacillus altitudinis]UTV31977.1 hypothetical protein NM966_14495 [Bacillus altitudinis]
MKHESKSECLEGHPLITTILYLIGSIKLIKDHHPFREKMRYDVKLRALHPAAWPIILFMFIIGGFNRDTVDIIKSELVLW